MLDPVHVIAASVGFASLALLWMATVAGVVLARGWAMTRIRHSTMLAAHHTLALLGLCLGVVHALAQLAAPAGTMELMDEFVPFTNDLDPVGVGVGVLAIELNVALTLSVLIQRKLGYHRWRALHAIAYSSYTLVVGHVLISGSETGSVWVSVPILASLVFVVGLWLLGSVKSNTREIAEKVTTRLRGRLTTVQVDPVRCARFGFCEQESPEVFNLRSDGQLAYRSVVPAEHADAALRAARVCPARAILLNQPGAPVNVPVPPPPPSVIPIRPLNGGH